MPNSTALLHLTEGFYGAALGLGSWRAALEGFADTLGADHMILNAATPSPFLATARVDEADVMWAFSLQAYLNDDGPPTAGVQEGEATMQSFLMPDAEYRRTAHFNELIRPLGGHHSIYGKATAAARGSSLFVCRGARRAAFEDADVAVVAALMPHLSMALAFGARLATGTRPSGEGALLEAFQGPALICDANARVLRANAAARALLEATDGIALGAARLASMNPADTERLRDIIANVSLGTGWSRPGSVRIRLQRRAGRVALSLRLVPAGHICSAIGDPRSVAIFITEPDAPLPVDRPAVAEAYGLAPREVEVASLMAAGASITGIAAATGLKVATVRVYLKHVFDKTNAHSQASLVALLRGFV